jgi:EAL domain-containing protein (putative c-di-GMP-specific phosphodiesterase class I)
VTGLAGNLGIRSLAEGVESWQQVEQLQNLGCDELQGYLFGRPSPISDVGQLVGAAGSVAPVGSPAPRPDRVVAE